MVIDYGIMNYLNVILAVVFNTIIMTYRTIFIQAIQIVDVIVLDKGMIPNIYPVVDAVNVVAQERPSSQHAIHGAALTVNLTVSHFEVACLVQDIDGMPRCRRDDPAVYERDVVGFDDDSAPNLETADHCVVLRGVKRPCVGRQSSSGLH